MTAAIRKLTGIDRPRSGKKFLGLAFSGVGLGQVEMRWKERGKGDA